MMVNKWLCRSLGAAFMSASVGCGTMTNFDTAARQKMGKPEGPVPFGGVRRDVKWTGEVMSFDCPLPNKVFVGIPMCTLYMLDVPFSAVGDVVTLPIVMLGAEKEPDLPATTPVADVPKVGNAKEKSAHDLDAN